MSNDRVHSLLGGGERDCVSGKGFRMNMMLPKSPAFVSPKLRKFAEGQDCQMMSEWCNSDPSTVVLCHSRRRAGAGMSEKPHDFWGYHGCSECHRNEHLLEDRELYDAIRRTQYLVFLHFGTLTPGGKS